jgi:hypothetical protein
VSAERLEVHRHPTPDDYQDMHHLQRGEPVAPQVPRPPVTAASAGGEVGASPLVARRAALGVHSRGHCGKIAYTHVYRLSFCSPLAGELSPLERLPPGKGSEQRTSLLHHMARWYLFHRAGEGVPPTMDKGSSTNALTLRETPMQFG